MTVALVPGGDRVQKVSYTTDRIVKIGHIRVSFALYSVLFLVLILRNYSSNKNIVWTGKLGNDETNSLVDFTQDDDAGRTVDSKNVVVELPDEEIHAYPSEQESITATTTKTSSSTPIIAFAVPITHCSATNSTYYKFPASDAAAVLQHTIHHNSIRNKEGTGRYDYRLYAIYHPKAAECAPYFEEMGYELLEREFPVKVEEIEGEYLRNEIAGSGCCGERELIKLEVFNLTQHPLVVLTDLDVLILKPLDTIFDLMLFNIIPPEEDHLMKPGLKLPERIDLFYTADYTMVYPQQPFKPVQGGFVVVRPNQTVYQDYIDIVRKGDFRKYTGWGGLSEEFWGSLTFQGLIPYYFTNLYPGRSVELNWCLYNNAGLAPREDLNHSESYPDYGECWTNETECEDCRQRPANEIYLFHFTFCFKPWSCTSHLWGDDYEAWMNEHPLCRQLHHAWFNTRAALEQSWGRSGWNSGTYDRDHFYGSCTEEGEEGYIPIQKPYHRSLDI